MKLAAWWRRAWYWPNNPPSRRRCEPAETVLLKPRPVPFPMPGTAADDKTRPGPRVAPWVAAPPGTHRRSPR